MHSVLVYLAGNGTVDLLWESGPDQGNRFPLSRLSETVHAALNIQQSTLRSGLSMAIGTALCRINRFRVDRQGLKAHGRLLIVTPGSQADAGSQHIPLMNSAFCAQKLEIPIDVLRHTAHHHRAFALVLHDLMTVKLISGPVAIATGGALIRAMSARCASRFSANSAPSVLVAIVNSSSLLGKDRVVCINELYLWLKDGSGTYVAAGAHQLSIDGMRKRRTMISMFSMLVVLLMSATLSSTGATRKKKLVGSTVLGIDLGGSFMKAAYVAPGEEDPFPILLSDLSERKSSYAVAFRKGKRLFGTHASKAAITNPESTFTYLGSHLLGRPFTSPQVQAYRELYTPALEADPERGTVVARDEEGKPVPVEHLVGLYLDNVKVHAQSEANRHVAGAVITVPSYYDQRQRRALLEAAEIAGLKVQALINPASAAAIYYGTQVFNGKEPQHVLVFDAGATGTSAAVVLVDPNGSQNGVKMTSIEVKSIASTMSLSGQQIDTRLAKILATRFEAEHKGAVRLTPGKAYNRLLVEAIRVKSVLSANTEILSGVEDLVGDYSLGTRVTRDELEAACADMVPEVEAVVKEALQRAHLSGPSDLALVIPVGGNSRVPFVMNALRAAVGENLVAQTLNAEEAAAKGATLYAAALHATFRLKPFRFRDVIPDGLQLQYSDASGSERKVEAYPIGSSQLESHKGVSLRGLPDAPKLAFAQMPEEHPLYRLHVDDLAKVLASVPEAIDSKLKIWMDIDRSGVFRMAPPAVLFQVERTVTETSKTTTSAASETTSNASETSTATSSATTTSVPPPPPVTTTKQVTETRAIQHRIEDLYPVLPETVKDACRKDIVAYRAALEIQLLRAEARNDLESAFYRLRSELDNNEFTRWFKSAEVNSLKTALAEAALLLDDDKPEMTREHFSGLLERINTIQAEPIGRRDEAEKRPSIVAEVQKIIAEASAYANNTLHVFEPEKRAQTNEELESLLRDATEMEADLATKISAQQALADNEDPAFKCAEISARAELLKMTVKMLKKKVLPPPKPTTTAAAAGAEATDATTPDATGSTTEPTVEEPVKEHSDL